MKKYKTERYSHDIREAEVTKESDHSVFFPDGSRELKVTHHHRWHDSREEARTHLVERLQGELIALQRKTRQAMEALQRFLNEYGVEPRKENVE